MVDEPTVKQIKETYRYYFEGKLLVAAAKEAGFNMNHRTKNGGIAGKDCNVRKQKCRV